MKQDLILILDLGSEENSRGARAVRALGVYSEIHPHDITLAELNALPNVKGIILNGGVNRVVDGVEIDASAAVYNSGLPVWAIDHKGAAPLANEGADREKAIRDFGFYVRKATEQDIMRLLAVYYQQDVTTEVFEHFDGERWFTEHGK